MTNHYHSKDLGVDDERALEQLERAIAMSEGQFSLILVCCNSPRSRVKVVKQLRKRSRVQVRRLTLHPSVNTLLTTILTSIEAPPPALMIFGLESVVAIDQVLSATNLVRDEFRKQFPFPLVLWINDEILQKLTRVAPDFKSWAANPIRFEGSSKQARKLTAITA